jgi:hypothetical protein
LFAGEKNGREKEIFHSDFPQLRMKKLSQSKGEKKWQEIFSLPFEMFLSFYKMFFSQSQMEDFSRSLTINGF